MLTLKDWMGVAGYKVTEGSEFGWNCYGDNAYMLSYWNGEQDGFNVDIIFDTKTQLVYECDVCDYKRERAYRWFNPDFKAAHDARAEMAGEYANQAWDDINYIDLEVPEDWVEKATAIVNDEDYDERITVPLDLSRDEMFDLAMRAHECDMTLNDYVAKILMEMVQQHKAYKC